MDRLTFSLCFLSHEQERLYPTLRGSSVQTLAEELQKLTAKVGEMGVQSMMRNATSFAWQSLVKGLGEDQEERQESLQKALHQQQRLNEQLQLVRTNAAHAKATKVPTFLRRC